jgi:general secretion pathway protein G
MMSNFTQRQCQRGFTLIELLVVLVILGLLMSVVGPRVMKYVGGAKTDTARMQIEELAGALDMYHLEVGRYPTQDMGLQALVQQPTGVARWNGPYLRKSNIPTDPWGSDYVYRFPGQHGAFDLYSLGADGQEGGEGEDAEIGSWQ